MAAETPSIPDAPSLPFPLLLLLHFLGMKGPITCDPILSTSTLMAPICANSRASSSLTPAPLLSSAAGAAAGAAAVASSCCSCSLMTPWAASSAPCTLRYSSDSTTSSLAPGGRERVPRGTVRSAGRRAVGLFRLWECSQAAAATGERMGKDRRGRGGGGQKGQDGKEKSAEEGQKEQGDDDDEEEEEEKGGCGGGNKGKAEEEKGKRGGGGGGQERGGQER